MTADLDAIAGELLTAGETPRPGSWRSALYRPDAPGAALDAQPWARSWGAFMRAVTDPMDPAAREFIARVEAARVRNAGFSERVPAEGGFLIPEYLRSQVLAYMTTAIIRPKAMVLPMASLKLGIPNLDNPSQASGTQALGGLTFAWTEEGAAITPSAPEFGRTTLEARKAAALLQDVPSELVEDAAGAFGDFLARVISLGYAWFEDDGFINGTGTGEPQGLLNAPCAIQVDRAGSDAVAAADIVSMYKSLHSESKRGDTACWLVSDEAFSAILDITAQVGTAPASAIAGTSMWLNWSESGKCWMLLGQPLYPTDHLPEVGTTGDVVLADLAHYVIGDRMEMTVERSQQGAGFGSDTSSFRVRARLDGRYWIQSSTTTEAGQVVSPVVILNSAS
jgi:HK97 family phage major capsid protein